MAFSLDHLLESVVPAVISGGGTALSTILAFFRDIKKRVEELEKKIGSIDSKTGLVYSIHLMEEGLKSVREHYQREQQGDESWPRRRPGSFTNLESVGFEERLRKLEGQFKDIEECHERLESKIKRCVPEEDFEQADRQRAEEIAQVKNTMAEVRGLLQGLQSALGLIKPSR